MNTNRWNDHTEQNFRFLIPIEFLELDILSKRMHEITSHKKEREEWEKKNKVFFKKKTNWRLVLT